MNRKAFRAALRLRPERYAAMVTWSQWHAIHLVGLAVKRRFPDVPWIAHFSDPWVDNPFAHYRGISRAYFRRLETSVHQAADILSFTSEETIDLKALSGANAAYRGKAVALPHGFEPDLYPDVLARREGPFMLRSLGNFYGARSPVPLFRALAILRGRDPALFDRDPRRVDRFDSRRVWRGSQADSPQRHRAALAAGRLQNLAALDALRRSPAQYRRAIRAKHLPAEQVVDYIGAERRVLGITPPGPRPA